MSPSDSSMLRPKCRRRYLKDGLRAEGAPPRGRPRTRNKADSDSEATTVAVGRSLEKEADEYDQYFDTDQFTAAQQKIDRIEREALGAATWNQTIHPFASTSATAPAARSLS
ncbi:hypothetical protein R3P38DRAFT_3374353 [Favolaschia claudopus]|uniref:Uncharacterized protein n=1 Tax=Favolaschia claudopus TaxID=2862362 RepID=A0AAV9ZNB6_9AGAR